MRADIDKLRAANDNGASGTRSFDKSRPHSIAGANVYGPLGFWMSQERVEITVLTKLAEAGILNSRCEKAGAALPRVQYTKDGRVCTTSLTHGCGDFIPDDWFDKDMTPAVRARIDQRTNMRVEALDQETATTRVGISGATCRPSLKELASSYDLTLGSKELERLLALNAFGRDLVLEIKANNPSVDLAHIIAELDIAGGL